MGKRKSSKPPPKRRQEKLDTKFTCPFCNHPEAVWCKMKRRKKIGKVKCLICQEKFSMMINALSAPIDVYSEWIDECELANP